MADEEEVQSAKISFDLDKGDFDLSPSPDPVRFARAEKEKLAWLPPEGNGLAEEVDGVGLVPLGVLAEKR